MKTLNKKLSTIALIVCFLANTFTYSAFGSTLPAPISDFKPPLLKYLSINSANPYNYFNFLVDTGNRTINTGENMVSPLQGNVKQLINYFFLGLTLPEDSFWVNLNPNEPNRLTSDSLSKTDMGKVLLEQDLLLKKQTSQYLNPRNRIGKQFWQRLYETLGTNNIKKQAVTTSNRVWIVPDKATLVETEDGVLISEAKLKVLTEEDYFSLEENVSRIPSSVYRNEIRNTEYGIRNKINKISNDLIREIIIPELTFDVNNLPEYAKLRQIYHSLILASYYKDKHHLQGGTEAKRSDSSKVDNGSNPYSSIINTNNTTGLESQYPWSKDKIWQDYVKSYKKGEYKIKKKFFGLNRMYFSGGIMPYVTSSSITVIHNTAPPSLKKAYIPQELSYEMLALDTDPKDPHEREIGHIGVLSTSSSVNARGVREKTAASLVGEITKLLKQISRADFHISYLLEERSRLFYAWYFAEYPTKYSEDAKSELDRMSPRTKETNRKKKEYQKRIRELTEEMKSSFLINDVPWNSQKKADAENIEREISEKTKEREKLLESVNDDNDKIESLRSRLAGRPVPQYRYQYKENMRKEVSELSKNVWSEEEKIRTIDEEIINHYIELAKVLQSASSAVAVKPLYFQTQKAQTEQRTPKTVLYGGIDLNQIKSDIETARFLTDEQRKASVGTLKTLYASSALYDMEFAALSCLYVEEIKRMIRDGIIKEIVKEDRNRLITVSSALQKQGYLNDNVSQEFLNILSTDKPITDMKFVHLDNPSHVIRP